MKKILIIAGAILIAVLLSAGSFWGGIMYQTNRVNQIRANFINSRGQPNGGQFPNDGQFPNGGQGPGFFGGGGTTGQVNSIDGNVLTVSTAQNTITVNLSESTQVEKSEPVTIADLQPGMQVMVTGQRDSNGNITASRVRILNNNSTGPTNPSATETAP